MLGAAYSKLMLCMPIFDHERGAIKYMYTPCLLDFVSDALNLDPKTYHSVHMPRVKLWCETPLDYLSHFITVLLAATKSRTLEPLAFDEYCRFDTSAFFYRQIIIFV
jgi:hypothetical protein